MQCLIPMNCKNGCNDGEAGGGEHLVPRVLFYVFGASGTSYSLRAPCIRFWRSPSNTFSENSAMCLNTRTECDCYEENACAEYIFWDFVVGMGFHGNVSKTHVYVFHVSRTLRFAPRYCAMAIDTWKAPRTRCLLFSIWNAKARTMRGMHFPATRVAARKYRVGLE